MTLWMAVIADKYELPMAVAGNATELGKMLGYKGNMVSKMYCMHRKGIYSKWTKYKIVKVKINERKIKDRQQ